MFSVISGVVKRLFGDRSGGNEPKPPADSKRPSRRIQNSDFSPVISPTAQSRLRAPNLSADSTSSTPAKKTRVDCQSPVTSDPQDLNASQPLDDSDVMMDVGSPCLSPSASPGCKFLHQRSLPEDVELLATEFAARFTPYTDLRVHLSSLTQNQMAGMAQEFKALETFDTTLEQIEDLWVTASKLSNRESNRYCDILANEPTRFKLDTGNNDYINCNVIDGSIFNVPQSYLCGQAPLPVTMAQWWHMIWQADVPVILMLAKLVEKGSTKAHIYWPKKTKGSITHGPYTITMVSESKVEDHDDVIKRTFSVTCAGSEARQVVQYQYTGWPDHGVPRDPKSFVRILELADHHMAAGQPSGPALVHCSAGVGRTGVFIATHIILTQLQRHRQLGGSEPFAFNLLRTVCQLRWCRSHLIQTPAQYAFCYSVVLMKSGL